MVDSSVSYLQQVFIQRRKQDDNLNMTNKTIGSNSKGKKAHSKAVEPSSAMQVRQIEKESKMQGRVFLRNHQQPQTQ